MGGVVNYYERHLGDYARDTAHLSMLEHGAYGLLLDRYYATEAGIPADQAHRLARAKSPAERAAVDAVLTEFFTLSGGLWINSRADREVEKAQTKIEAARRNGKTGGRPKKNPEGTQQKPTGLSLGSENGTQAKALQTPDTIEELSTPSVSHPPAVAGGKARPSVPCPYDAIVAAYHDALPSLPAVRLMGEPRKKAMRKVWGWVLGSTKPDGSRRATTADEALAWFGAYFARASDNDFLMGRGARSSEHAGWQCDIDFLLTDKGMRHVIEKTLEAA